MFADIEEFQYYTSVIVKKIRSDLQDSHYSNNSVFNLALI